MRLGMAEARRRFREVLDAVENGESVEVARRGQVVAVISSPAAARARRQSFSALVESWRRENGVDDWPDDDDVFEGVRDPHPGPPPPW